MEFGIFGHFRSDVGNKTPTEYSKDIESPFPLQGLKYCKEKGAW
jgi:hypothetical protein